MKQNYLWWTTLWMVILAFSSTQAQVPVLRYDFAGNANDLSGNNHHASIHGALLTADRFGMANNAFQFDGIQSRLVTANADDLQSGATTVSFWVRVDELPGQGEVFLMSHGGWQERWKISLPSHGKPVWTTNHENGISDMDAGDGHELQPGVWTHIVFIHDGSKDLIYFNGNLAAEKDVVGALNATGHPFGIAYDPIDGGLFFHGAIDDVMVFDQPLNAEEVSTLYDLQSSPPIFAETRVAVYPFNGNLTDESGYGNHAGGKDIQFTTDRFGFGKRAASFNGESSEMTANNSLPLNSPFTSVAFWIRVNELPGTGEAFVASFGGWQERWKISLPSHGKLVWTTNHTGGISDMDAGDGNALVPGQWTHVVVSHNPTHDQIFINGVLAAEKEVGGQLNATTYPLGFGYNVIDGGNFLDGALDEIAIYNYSLTAEEVADLYAAESTAVIDPNPLVAHFDFQGDLTDGSQFSNNGTSEGAGFTNDRFGYAGNAVYLDGTSGIDVDNSVQYQSDYTTVAFWVNLNQLPGTGEVFLLSHGGWQERWKISLPSHGKPVWTTNHSGGISDMDSGDGNALVPGQWMHVAVSHGPEFDRIYVDGELAAEKAVGGTLNKTGYNFGIGYNAVDGGGYAKGSFDDVRVYQIELTPEEVADLYAETANPPVFTEEIVADYALDGNARDNSVFRNHGANAGAIAAADRFGRANHSLSFNGVSSYVRAENSPQLNSPLTTVSFWIRVNNLPGNGEAYLLSLGGWQERWKISLPAHGKPVWTTNHTNGISDMDSGDGNELAPGEWTHVVFVHDGDKDLIYFNGDLAAEKDVVGLLHNTTHPLGIGYNIIDGGSYFDGQLDDILIFNTALTAEQIAELYAAQSADPGNPDTTPPSAPLNLTASVSFTNVTLDWLPSTDDDSGLAGYNVYLNGALSRTVESTTTTFNDLLQLTSYDFGVSAVDVAGNESAITSVTAVTDVDETPDITPPTAPSNLVVTPGAYSAVFSWDPSTDDTGIAGYVVLVDGFLVDTIPGNQTSIFIGGLEPSTLYAFEVYAFDYAGNDSEVSFTVVSTTAPIDTGEPGLVAHYKFEGDANDATPYNNHGTIGGDPVFEPVTNRPNASGMAIVFDGDQDSVLVPNAVQLISDFATVSFWVRPDDQNFADAESYILSFGGWQERWKISLPQHLKVVWTTNGKNSQFPNFISDMDSGDGNELVLGFWWHVTMVHDGTSDIIYLDGVEVNSKPVNGTLNSTAHPLGMGNNPIEGRQYFIGALDEVKIYNKALTAEEILQLYQTGTTGLFDVPVDIDKYVNLVYPNPTQNELMIKHSLGARHELLVRIFDVAGHQVGAQRFAPETMDQGQLTVNASHLAPGNYYVNFVFGGKNLGSLPFVKQ